MVKRDLKFWATFVGLKLLEIGGIIGLYLLGRWEVTFIEIVPEYQTPFVYGLMSVLLGILSSLVLIIVSMIVVIWIKSNINLTEKVLE